MYIFTFPHLGLVSTLPRSLYIVIHFLRGLAELVHMLGCFNSSLNVSIHGQVSSFINLTCHQLWVARQEGTQCSKFGLVSLNGHLGFPLRLLATIAVCVGLSKWYDTV